MTLAGICDASPAMTFPLSIRVTEEVFAARQLTGFQRYPREVWSAKNLIGASPSDFSRHYSSRFLLESTFARRGAPLAYSATKLKSPSCNR
jgi:hypothetical protein